MSTDTAVADTQVKPQVKTYFSHNPNLQLIRVKPDEQVTQGGKTVVKNMSDYLRFMVEFHQGFFFAQPGDLVCPNPDTGEEEDVVTFLENHPRFGQEFHLQADVAPDPTEVMMQVAELSMAQDGEGLVELYRHEKDNWARPQVLEPIEAAVAKLEELTKG